MLIIHMWVHRGYMDADRYPEEEMRVAFKLQVSEVMSIGEFISKVAPGGSIMKQDEEGGPEQVMQDSEFFQDNEWYEFFTSDRDLEKAEDGKVFQALERSRVWT